MSKKKNKTYKLYQPKKRQSKQFVNKIIKRDIIMYSILAFSLILLTTTSSYAFLSTEVNTVELENIVSSSIEGVTLVNNNINIDNLDTSSNYMYEFTVDNINTEVAKNIKYTLKINNNTFNNLKFKIYKGDKASITTSNPLYTSDKLSPSINEIEITGLDDYIIANTKQTYTIVFELDKVDNQEMYDAYKDFSANIYIDLKTTGSLGE